MHPLHPGDPQVVGRYRLLGRLGEGGMGRVYLGRTPEGQHAAVKVVHDELAAETGFRHRFRREVSAAVAVAGLFTARVLDADPDADPPWLATQYVEGPSLRELVLRQGPLDEPSQLRLALGLAEALSAIHAAGLVHRDLKPGNVLLAADGARVIDFGIAHAAGASPLTGTGQLMGTVEYMSPEQVAADGPPGPASDVFALGATLCFAATGRGPFGAGSGAGVLYRILEGEPDLRGMPPSTARIAAMCLVKDPARRPAAPLLASWLRAGDGPTHALRVPAPPRRRRTALVIGVATAALVVGGATAAAVTVAASGTSPLSPGPVTTGPVGAPPSTVASTIDPGGPEARYVERLCSGGDLLITLADTMAAPSGSDDPAVLRQEYLATTGRAIGTVDVGLADFRVLRDDAPTAQLRTTFTGVVEEFTRARESFAAGQRIVEASDPLTPEAYAGGVDRFLEGNRSLSLAAQLMRQLELPPSYAEARAVAPSCDG